MIEKILAWSFAVAVFAAMLFIGLVASAQPEASSPVADITFKTSNTASLTDEVSSKTISKLIMDIESTPDKQVYLFISSPGGSVSAGLEFISYLKATEKQVTCVADFAASMAFAIFQACPTRVVMEHSILMQHEASFGLAAADVPNQMSLIGLIQRQLELMDNMQAARIGLSLTELRERTRDDWWIYGIDNKTLGTTDSVGTVACSPSLLAKRVESKVTGFFGSWDVVYSGCPLLTYPLDIKQAEGFRPYREFSVTDIKLINTLGK